MTIDPARNPLRRARLAARLELSDLAERTRISPGMLRYMDEGAFDRLPAGIYARSWVRTVAEALSLDPADVLRQVEHALPLAAPLEPEPAESPGAAAPREAAEQPARWWGGSSGQLMSTDRWRRAGVAALDGLILTGVTIAVWIITAAAVDANPAALGAAGAIGLSAIALTVAVAYFVVFAGIGGRTPGAAVLGYPEQVSGRLDLAGVGRRALQAALAEASIAVDALVAAGADELVLRSVLRRT